MTVWPCVSGLSTVFVAVGSFTLMPCCNRGATSIMMISSTSMTSTSGVTLMSDLTPPLAPPRSIAIRESPYLLVRTCETCDRAQSASSHVAPHSHRYLGRLLDEVVHQLRRGVVHFDVEVFDAA